MAEQTKIGERLLDYGARVIKLEDALPILW